MKEIGSDKMRKAYTFLLEQERLNNVFTLKDFISASGWSENTARGNRSKKLARYFVRVDGGYKCTGMNGLTEEAFCRLCSQSAVLAHDPHRPLLKSNVEALVIKARESALAAVQQYNNPASVFRSGNYIVLMIIAYTSLFHAVFERDGIDYVAYDRNNNPRTVDGNKMLWDVDKCVRHYENDRTTPLVKNIQFFLPIRNKIEHRLMPELDAKICSHCQSLLMNFEQILLKEFTAYYALNASLTLALQFSTQRSTETINAMRRLQSAEYQEVKKYIMEYEASLPDDILENSAYAFRVWLIPKTARDARNSDISIEYIPRENIDQEKLVELEQSIVAIKQTVREARNISYLKAGDVSKRVAEAIGKRFHHSSAHVQACKRHKVRPSSSDGDKSKTNIRYCVWDQAFRQYVYTEEWVKLLISEYSNEENYEALMKWREET